jgi:hypothetical protein
MNNIWIKSVKYLKHNKIKVKHRIKVMIFKAREVYLIIHLMKIMTKIIKNNNINNNNSNNYNN